MRDDVTLLCGVERPDATPWEPFDPRVMEALAALSQTLRGPNVGEETAALGFWCRKAHLEALAERHKIALPRLGRGHIFHVAPSNVPALFGYSLAIGLLAGNGNTVRLSQRRGAVEEEVCRAVERAWNRPEFAPVWERISVISYPRESELTAETCAACDGRVVWGGDETVAALRAMPRKPQGMELSFPDRWSMALLSQNAVAGADEETLAGWVHRFYNDTYRMDQRGCSSPKLVLWLEDGPMAAWERWWQALGREVRESYEWNFFKAARKNEILCRWAAEWPGKAKVENVGDRRLVVVTPEELPADLTRLPGGFGLFFQGSVTGLEELAPHLTPKVQTLVCLGLEPEPVARELAELGAAGVDRVVLPGQALEMDTIWDGTDLIAGLSRVIQ